MPDTEHIAFAADFPGATRDQWLRLVDGVLKGEMDIQALHAKRLTLFGVSNKLRTAEQRAAGVGEFVADLLPTIIAQRVRPVIDSVYPFEQLPQAKAHMESNRHLGKIALAMPTLAAEKGKT